MLIQSKESKDVLSTPDTNPTGSKTFKAGELMEIVKNSVGGIDPNFFTDEGMEVQYLSLDLGEWQTGKARISITFEPSPSS